MTPTQRQRHIDPPPRRPGSFLAAWLVMALITVGVVALLVWVAGGMW